MRNLVLLFAALLVAGCGEKSAIEKALEEAVELNSLQERNDLYYQVNKSEPYSGWVKVLYDLGQARRLFQVKDGKPDGPYTLWHENGRKQTEGIFKDGEPDGLYTGWFFNGQKKEEATFKDGEVDGPYMKWHDNGQKMAEGTYKDGESVSGKYWNSKGEEVENLLESQK